MLSTILLIVLILALLGSIPHFGYNSTWGYGPFGLISILLIVFIVLAVTGRI